MRQVLTESLNDPFLVQKAGNVCNLSPFGAQKKLVLVGLDIRLFTSDIKVVLHTLVQPPMLPRSGQQIVQLRPS
jgi:hypothetical protein